MASYKMVGLLHVRRWEKRTKPFLIDENWYKVVSIASAKINMLVNYQWRNGATA